ncbi:MAG TPA: GGDEF domain-containing protein [Kineosporiaceae bacterium]
MNDGALTGAPRTWTPGLPGQLARRGDGTDGVRIDLVAAERIAEQVRRALTAVPAGHDPAITRRWLRTVERLLPLAGEHDRARLLQARAAVRSAGDPHGRGRPAEAVLADAATAAELFEQMGEPLPAATNFVAAANAAAATGHIPLALETTVRALVALGDVPPGGGRRATGAGAASEHGVDVEASLAARLGALCHQFLDYPRALRFYELALAACGSDADGRWCPAVTALADVLLARVGELPPADADRPGLLDRAEALARRLASEGHPEVFRTVHGPRLLADVMCERGRPAAARDVLAAIPPDLPDDLAGPVHLSRGRTLMLLDRPVEAVARFDLALAALAAEPHRAERLHGLRLRSAARQAAGDVPGALADALLLADLLWSRHQRQVGGFMDQLWSRAGAEGEAQALLVTAEQDPLTGLANRRAVERFCASLHPGSGICLVLIDVDHFKTVNDRFGHGVGDAVLRETASLLTRSVRAMDIVARWGGEEFLIALPGGSGRLGADAAARVCRRVRDHGWFRLARGLRVTVSAGVASGTAAGLGEVLHRADTALYTAKASGRDRAVAR